MTLASLRVQFGSMKTIYHDGAEHRIDRPTRCPACAAAERGEGEVPGDGMAVDVEFACGAVARWRSVLATADTGASWHESLAEERACPSPAADRLGRAVVAGWGFTGARPPRGEHDRGCVWVRAPGEEGWRAEKGSGSDWLTEALDDAGVPE